MDGLVIGFLWVFLRGGGGTCKDALKGRECHSFQVLCNGCAFPL